MFSVRTKVITVLLLTTSIFGIDCFIVPGYSFWLLYLLPFAILYYRPARDLYRFAALVSLLMIIGYFVPSFGRIPVTITAVNRVSGIAVVWLTAFLLQRMVGALNHAHEEHHKLQRLIETLPAGVMFAYPSGEIALANAAATEALGGTITGTSYGPQGKYTLHKLDGTLLTPDELPLTRALEKGESTRGMPLLVRYETGVERFLSADVAPIQHDHSRREGAVAVLTDVTESERARKQLADERNFTNAVLETQGTLVVVLDPSGSIVRFNRECETLTGYSRDEVTGKSFFDLFLLPEERPGVEAISELLQVSETTIAHENHWIKKTGDKIYVRWRNTTLRDKDGNAEYLIATGIDISDRKQAEEALRQSEAQFRQLADAMPQLVWITRPDGYHEYFNKRWYEFTGTQPGETAGEMWARLLYPDDYQRTLDVWHHSLRTGEPYSIEYRFKRGSDDTYHWFIGRAVPVRNARSEITRWFGTCTYIHDLKITEQALRESEATLNAVLETLPSGVIIADAQGRITRTNPAARELWGIPPETVSWEQYSEWIGWWPETGERIKAEEWAMSRAIRNGEKTRGEILQNQKFGSDERRYFINSAAPLLDSEGRIMGGVVAVLDITDRREAEASLQHRTEELAAVNRDLESFSYSVSHDLRNPLSATGGFAQFLIEDYAEQLDEEGRDYLHRINDNVAKMQRLIDDMLNLSRIGRQEIRREEVDLSAMVRNYLQELKTLEPERVTDFFIQNNIHAKVDPRLIHLALENLLRNAWKFTMKKEITQIGFGITDRGGQTVYFIRDNGEGFDMRFTQTIFEPFKRVHAQKEFGGTGVGLSIVQRVIERHGGKVWAEGKVGKGAVFLFTLGG